MTIDYGPYGWTDNFDLGWTPNTTDAQQHRYAFGDQPSIGLWNIARLGESLLPLFDGDETCIEAAATHYQKVYSETATKRFADKLGITFDADKDDGQLLQDLFDWLGKEETDMTLFFRSLAKVVVDDEPTSMPGTTHTSTPAYSGCRGGGSARAKRPTSQTQSRRRLIARTRSSCCATG